MTNPCLHLARDGRSLGRNDPPGVAAALLAGELRPDDLSWREGEPAWIPLARRAEFAAITGRREAPAPALEPPRAHGLLRAAALTLRETLLAPGATFTRLPREAGWWPPLLLHLTVACLANGLGLLWAEWFVRPVWERSLGLILPFLPWEQVFRLFGWLALLTPLLVLIGAWVGTSLLHVMLRLLGGGQGGWAVTFRVGNYVGAAANLVIAIPFLGILAIPWGLYCLVFGLAAAHRDPAWRPMLGLVLAAGVSGCALLGAALLALAPFLMELAG